MADETHDHDVDGEYDIIDCDEFDCYDEVDSTTVDSTEGAPS